MNLNYVKWWVAKSRFSYASFQPPPILESALAAGLLYLVYRTFIHLKNFHQPEIHAKHKEKDELQQAHKAHKTYAILSASEVSSFHKFLEIEACFQHILTNLRYLHRLTSDVKQIGAE